MSISMIPLPSRDPSVCCICKRKPVSYTVGLLGYCMSHRAEAIKALNLLSGSKRATD